MFGKNILSTLLSKPILLNIPVPVLRSNLPNDAARVAGGEDARGGAIILGRGSAYEKQVAVRSVSGHVEQDIRQSNASMSRSAFFMAVGYKCSEK